MDFSGFFLWRKTENCRGIKFRITISKAVDCIGKGGSRSLIVHCLIVTSSIQVSKSRGVQCIRCLEACCILMKKSCQLPISLTFTLCSLRSLHWDDCPFVGLAFRYKYHFSEWYINSVMKGFEQTQENEQYETKGCGNVPKPSWNEVNCFFPEN